METVYLSIDPINPRHETVMAAVRFLEQEELVAFPTETVYGVGALAQSTNAVKKIFAAKERPATNPLQVHISRLNQLRNIISCLPAEAEKLMDRFWPGPLSIILPAARQISAEVCGRTGTVALRMPSHPVALALIDEAGPLAATSANLSGRPSPLSADDVKADLDGRIRAVLNAGRTGSGLESTVLNLCQGSYQVLRRGGIAVEEIEEILGKRVEVAVQAHARQDHYQVRTRVSIAKDEKEFSLILNNLNSSSGTVGIVYNDFSSKIFVEGDVPAEARIYRLNLGQNTNVELYSILRQAEQEGLNDLIFAPLPIDSKGVTASIVDRILAAANRGQISGPA